MYVYTYVYTYIPHFRRDLQVICAKSPQEHTKWHLLQELEEGWCTWHKGMIIPSNPVKHQSIKARCRLTIKSRMAINDDHHNS